MSRLSDPTTCPDCRGTVSSDAVCTSCGLALTGPLATQLWRTMLAADALVEQLRRQQAPAVAAAVVDGPRLPAPKATVPAPAPHARPGLSGRAVPVFLLSLGGLFVFVAVSLFLAVTWQVLPLAVKAALMLGLTGAVAAGAARLSRKGLRGSSEALWALVAALLMLDLRAGYTSGLLGLDGLSGRAMTTLGGVVLLGLGTGVALWAQRTAVTRCVAAEWTLVIGVLVATSAQVWTRSDSNGLAEAIAVPVLAGLGLALGQRLRGPAYAVFAIAGLTWILLAATGAYHGLTSDTRAEFWTGFQGWPLLLAAVYAAAVAAVRTLGAELRVAAAGSTLGALALLALLPPEWSTREVLVVAALVLVLAAVVRFTGLPWAPAATGLGGAGVAVTGLALTLLPAAASLAFFADHGAWTTGPATRFPTVTDAPSVWTLAALVIASVALLLAASPAAVRPQLLRSLPAVSLLTVTTGLAGSGQPMWLVVAGFAVTAVAGLVAGIGHAGHGAVASLLLGLESAVLSLAVGCTSDVVLAVLATSLTVAAMAGFALVRGDRTALVRSVAAPATVALTAVAAGSWAHVLGAARTVEADVLTVVAIGFLLAASYVVREPAARILTEATAGLVGVVAVAATHDHPAHLAMTLTLLGSAVALLSVLRHDRVHLGWLGSAVLTVGTVVRLDTGSSLGAEVYTLPAAALLVAVGCYRLLREPALGTWTVLGSGLTLALAPSLLIALPEPTSLRAFLVGLGAALALVVGVERRWQAPFLVGTAVLAVIALRFLLPLAQSILADPLGAWILFGAVGAACLAAGILWEQSLRNLRIASRYVVALR